jgi:UDP-glucose 4-epimerase
MKVLVTGALGHIGSGLIRALPKHFPEVEIKMVDNMMTQRYCSLFNLPAGGKYEFLEEDITKTDLDVLMDGVDVVIHLAAITDAAGSFEKANEVEENNYTATSRIADACARLNIRLITLSSTSVYGTQNELVDEDCTEDELNPQSPYAVTKLKEEKYVQELAKNKDLRSVILRFGTIFGISEGMRFHTAVNKFCWQSVLGKPISVWRTAYEQKRPYLDLQDAISAFCFIIEKDIFDGRIYNVVTINSTVRDIVETIKVFVPDLKIGFVDNTIMNQLSYEVSSKRFASLGFTPKGDLKSGVAKTIELLKSANAGSRKNESSI